VCVYVSACIMVYVCLCVEMTGICVFGCVCLGRESETEKKNNPLTPVCEGFWSPKRCSYVEEGLTCKS
jgi:hypothetical protein